VKLNGNTCNITPGSSFTIYDAQTIKEEFVSQWHSGQSVTIDLTSTQDIDTAGVQLLLAMARKVTDSGGNWRITANEETNNFLSLYNIDCLLSTGTPAAEMEDKQ